MSSVIRIAQVILPLSVDTEYSYRIPETWSTLAQVGMRALVQFAQRRYYYVILSNIIEVEADSEEATGLKDILFLPDSYPLVTPEEINLWRWGAKYYMCSVGHFLIASLPNSYLPSSDTEVEWQEHKAAILSPLAQEIRHSINKSPKHCCSLKKLAKLHGRQIYTEVDLLLKSGILVSKETIAHSGRGLNIGTPAVRLAHEYQSDEGVAMLLELLRRAPAQRHLVEELVALLYPFDLSLDTLVPKYHLTQQDSNRQGILRKLLHRGLLTEGHTVYDPWGHFHHYHPWQGDKANPSTQLSLSSKLPNLYIAPDNSHQVAVIEAAIDTTLSHTPEAVILIVVPQIQLLEQSLLYRRISQRRDLDIYIYGRSTTESKRIAIRNTLLRVNPHTRPAVILSTRMGVLLPLAHCSLIVISDEECTRYKQSDPAPRYHARDLAVVACREQSIPLLLTSVAPSAEALHNLRRGYYLPIDFPSALPPTPTSSIEVIDLAHQRTSGRLPAGKTISIDLRKRILETCAAGQKALLMLNRRGYAPHLICKQCQSTLKCPHCDVGLIYHKSAHSLICSYCNYTSGIPHQCPICHHTPEDASAWPFALMGYGIERIIEELTQFLPETIRIIELSADRMQRKGVLQDLQQHLSEPGASVIVGTSIVAYLDAIQEVGLIALVHLEQLIVGSDFRSIERAYAVVHRLRNSYPGVPLVLQSYSPDAVPIEELSSAEGSRLLGMQELREREIFHFPPFVRLMYLYVKGVSEGDVAYVSSLLAQQLQHIGGGITELEVFPPTKPYVSWVRLRHTRYLCIKIAPQVSWVKIREQIRAVIQEIQKSLLAARKLQIYCDVDPL